MIKIPYTRGIFCNRTLNLRAIPVIGYDMDYTLVHYKVEAWEGLAYQYIKKYLKKDGWPVDDLVFDPSIFIRGLVIDKELGNIVKVNRFGYVKAAYHGTQRLQFEKMRDVYSRTIVDLADTRYAFLNTLFSISEACIFSQLVDLLDHGKITGVLNYADLAQHIRTVLDQAHLEGELKDEIMANPEQFVEVDPELPLTLLDQKHADKKLLLITNSGWKYSKFMMSYICDRYLPKGMDWRDLFDLIVVSARKPSFFTDKPPMFEIVDNDDGLLKPVIGEIKKNGCYLGGNASMIEKYLGVSGEEILYVGDHLFCDVSISKEVLRWRTALIIRELEEELQAIENAREDHRQIRKMMKEKEVLEGQIRHQQLILQRREKKYAGKIKENPTDIKSELRKLRDDLHELDVQISDLNVRDSKRFNTNWSYLMRTGNDKSKFTRQVERYADIYTSRVSNMLYYTPFMYFRSPRGSIPHDPVFYPEDLKE